MSGRLPRKLHAGAWWLWAIGLGAAATRTTNPLILGMIVSVAALAVALRKPRTKSADGFRFYLILALAAIAIRVSFRAVLGGGFGSHVLLKLPEIDLPSWIGGIAIGGAVTAEALLAALYDGMRLATIVVCVGAANSLADPRRLLRSLPRALYDVGTAAALALSLAPQLVDSVKRVSKARLLRGQPTRWWHARSLIAPVLEDAMHRSLATAAAMDSRGYGRIGQPGASHRGGTALAAFGLGLIGVGVFGLVGGGISVPLSTLALGVGLVLGLGGFLLAGRNVGRTVYRPASWQVEEFFVAGSGLLCTAAIWFIGWQTPTVITPPLEPLAWPTVPLGAVLFVLFAALAGFVSPPVELVVPKAPSTAIPRRATL